MRRSFLRKIQFTLIIFCITNHSLSLYADRHSEAEVKKILNEVESTFNDYIESGVFDYAPREAERARKYLENAKRMILQDERDFAFYELKKVSAHFKLFDAKRKMVNAELDLDHLKKSIK
ncbi:MAG: hypothetical protein N2316_04075 [Spirochaetes bacterium]|nr:hypothetical protein [Spirochaetota bacterium]